MVGTVLNNAERRTGNKDATSQITKHNLNVIAPILIPDRPYPDRPSPLLTVKLKKDADSPFLRAFCSPSRGLWRLHGILP